MSSRIWEYEVLKIEPGGFFGGKINTDEMKTRLNDLGKRGWELASSIETNISEGVTREVVLIFKRAPDQ